MLLQHQVILLVAPLNMVKNEVGMIKSQLIANLAAKMTHLPEKQVTDSINRVLELMSEALIKNQRIEIRGFGSFSLHYRPPRNAHNPKTGEKVGTVGLGDAMECQIVVMIQRPSRPT